MLAVSLPITFKTAFAGYKGVWLAAQTMGAQTSAWKAFGSGRVPGTMKRIGATVMNPCTPAGNEIQFDTSAR